MITKIFLSIYCFFLITLLGIFLKDRYNKNIKAYLLYTIINMIITIILLYTVSFLEWNNITVFVIIMMLFNFLVFLMFEKIEENTIQ